MSHLLLGVRDPSLSFVKKDPNPRNVGNDFRVFDFVERREAEAVRQRGIIQFPIDAVDHAQFEFPAEEGEINVRTDLELPLAREPNNIAFSTSGNFDSTEWMTSTVFSFKPCLAFTTVNFRS